MFIENDLEIEISEARRSIISDGYPVSIGELTNMYRDGELVIRPAFQRFFRWSDHQKSSLIESLLLGIPIPSIFVAQSHDGRWELIDGLQRVSTILELQGELTGKNDTKLPPLILQKTRYLNSLEGKTWTGPKDDCLTEAQKLDIKRSKIDVKIIKRESSQQTKYDLFQRLNNYGTSLSGQELRSALLVAVSPDFFEWIERLASSPNFITCTNLSDRLLDERFDVELVIKFLVMHNIPTEDLTLSKLRNFSEYLDSAAIKLAEAFPLNKDYMTNIFEDTFEYICKSGGECVFKRFDTTKSTFTGSFLSTSFEVFALGTGYALANNLTPQSNLLQTVKEFWAGPEMSGGYSTGKSTEARLVRFIPRGRTLIC